MHIKSIVAGAAIALAATVGSASAADEFSTLDGVTAEQLTPPELEIVRGADIVYYNRKDTTEPVKTVDSGELHYDVYYGLGPPEAFKVSHD